MNFVLLGIDARQGRPDDGDRPTLVLDGGVVGGPIDASSQSRYNGEVVADEFARETTRPSEAVGRRIAGADDGNGPGRHKIPPALVVEELNRMGRVS